MMLILACITNRTWKTLHSFCFFIAWCRRIGSVISWYITYPFLLVVSNGIQISIAQWWNFSLAPWHVCFFNWLYQNKWHDCNLMKFQRVFLRLWKHYRMVARKGFCPVTLDTFDWVVCSHWLSVVCFHWPWQVCALLTPAVTSAINTTDGCTHAQRGLCVFISCNACSFFLFIIFKAWLNVCWFVKVQNHKAAHE